MELTESNKKDYLSNELTEFLKANEPKQVRKVLSNILFESLICNDPELMSKETIQMFYDLIRFFDKADELLFVDA